MDMTSVNYKRLFHEAVSDAVRDYLSDHPELAVAGYWLVRLRKGTPLLPAKTYWFDDLDPENEILGWPLMAGEIAGEPANPLDIFAVYREDMPSDRLTQAAEYAWRVADLTHAKAWRPDDPLAAPHRRVRLTQIPPIAPPGE